MGFFELIKERHSIRSFKETEISDSDLQKILQACNSAPSAGNLQAYEIVAVTQKEIRQKLADAALGQNSITEAPAVLVFFTNPERSGKYGARGAELYSVQDATIAACYAQLAAAELGLATVWVGAFDDDGVRAVVNAPANMQPVAILPIGYANGPPRLKERRGLDDLVKEENF